MRPRFTPSTGCRRREPARRPAGTSRHRRAPGPPSPARHSRRRRPRRSRRPQRADRPGPAAANLRSTASAVNTTRSPMPLSLNTFSTRRPTSVASSRPPVHDDEQWSAPDALESLRPSSINPAHRVGQLFVTWRRIAQRARSHRKYSTFPRRARQRLAITPNGLPIQFAGRPKPPQRTAPARNCGIRHHPPAPTSPLPTSNWV